MPGERGNEAYGGETVPGQGSLEGFVLVGVRVCGITVKIQDHRRLLDPLGLDYIKVERISPSPLQLEQLHGVAGVGVIEEATEPRDRLQMAAAQRGRSPVLGNILKTFVAGVGNWRICRRELGGAGRSQRYECDSQGKRSYDQERRIEHRLSFPGLRCLRNDGDSEGHAGNEKHRIQD